MRSVKKFFLGFTVLFTLALCVGCGGGNELVGRYQDSLAANVVSDCRKGNVLGVDAAGDPIATGATYSIVEEAKRLHFETQAPGGEIIARDASYSYDKDNKVLTITGDDGTQQVMTKIN